MEGDLSFRYYIHYFKKRGGKRGRGGGMYEGYSGVVDFFDKCVVARFDRFEDAMVECARLNREFLDNG